MDCDDGFTCNDNKCEKLPNNVFTEINMAWGEICIYNTDGGYCFNNGYSFHTTNNEPIWYDIIKQNVGKLSSTNIQQINDWCEINNNELNCYNNPSITGIKKITRQGNEGKGCAITTDDKVLCWGTNQYGELGNGYKSDSYVNLFGPDYVKTSESTYLTNIKQIASTVWSVCALNNNGEVFCWGNNDYGNLGLSQDINEKLYATTNNLNQIKKIDAYHSKICAQKNNDELWCWGYEENCEFNQEGTIFEPKKIMNGITDFAITINHIYILKNNKIISTGTFDWNSNDKCEETTISITKDNPIKIFAEYEDVCVLFEDNSIYCANMAHDDELKPLTPYCEPLP